MTARPLVVSASQLRKELGGPAMYEYLDALADPDLLDPNIEPDYGAIRASADKTLESHLLTAQTDFEMETHIVLSHSRIKSNPVDPALVRGVDFDRIEDALDLDKSNWRGTGTIRVRSRPLISLERLVFRFGNGRQNLTREFDNEWVSPKMRLGILNVLSYFGQANTQPVPALPHWQLTAGSYLDNRIGAHLPSFVAVDYTAGLLPRDFNPDEDNPDDACADFPVRSCLEIVKWKAAVKTLGAVMDAIGAGGGSIAMDGLSENYDPNRFASRIQGYETRLEPKLKKLCSEFGGNMLMFSK